MFASDLHGTLHEITVTFEQLASKLEEAIEDLAHENSGGLKVAALQRARNAAQRAGNRIRDAASDIKPL